MKKLVWRNQKILRFSVVFALFAVSAYAQALGGSGSPFDTTIQALVTFAQGTFAHGIAIVAIIFGAAELAFGTGHGHGKIGGVLLGVGAMVYSPTIITWLFP